MLRRIAAPGDAAARAAAVAAAAAATVAASRECGGPHENRVDGGAELCE